MQITKHLMKGALALALSFGAWTPSQGQISVNPTDDQFVSKKYESQHAEWKEGESQFPGRPRDMWQLGVGAGSFLISGDVKSQFGWGASVHVRKSLGYVMSLKAEYMFGQASGLNYQASSQNSYQDIEPFTTQYAGPNTVFYSNYKIPQYHALSLQSVFNLNNIKFHKKSNKWSLNLIIGLGVNMYRTTTNALDANGNAYDFSRVALDANGDPIDLSTLSGRREVRNNIKGLLDDDYETSAQQNSNNIFTFGEDGKKMAVNPFMNVGLSLEYLITPRLSLALEHQGFISVDDYIDAKQKNETGDFTSNIDIPHYTSIRLGFHLGKKDKRIQPLWFVNPLVYPMSDVADLKKKLDDDLFKDDDNDGVPNKIDEEPDTPENAIVDTKGRTMDSDGDEVPDHLDKEPFSPPGYKVDEDGVAAVPKPITPEDVKVVGDNERLVIGDETFDPLGGGGKGMLNDWYLPMIHFDLDKYKLRPESYEQLRHIARVMQAYPDLKVVVHGHTDIRASDEYNDRLSYNRAMTAIDYIVNQYEVDRSRFIAKFNGEASNLIPSAAGEQEHFMNRRVEFYIAEESETEAPKPEGDGGRNRNWKY
ncbi:outer membrane protein/peptidoglycan-associated (lipo)protein [Saprospira grandis DSM 2844]|uniref:Outer membrane protein/peptidoglycan-associated (Lipo)protein n=1 Tax=Saprospira grandis DSM 2844 TaxID=694433 RepID=J1I4F5_9BACT|nr:OmpA family protein [Saprospira grandis]EJF53228.1 outer membrane protein/peptidoglycan-associated (lipo)protein [Saprospira grandis DSM 2844]